MKKLLVPIFFVLVISNVILINKVNSQEEKIAMLSFKQEHLVDSIANACAFVKEEDSVFFSPCESLSSLDSINRRVYMLELRIEDLYETPSCECNGEH